MELNQNKELLSNTLALNVALQTIKERCVHLQKRLYTLENENSQLRLNTINSNSDKRNESRRDNSLVSELEELRAKNAELTLQKNQLTENLSMISTENRKLWQRLSHLTKENIDDATLLKSSSSSNGEKEEQTIAGKHANLIRSKTFTQNSPHELLLLREKIAGNHIGPIDADLEDISLINDCDFTTATRANDGATLEQETCDDTDIDTRTCTEGLLNIKRELLKQNSDLKVALSNWRKFKNSDMCSCKTKCDKNNKKPLMIDKSLETERDLVTLDFLVDQDSPNNNFDITKRDHVLVDLIEKKKADLAEKICPMCGKFYKQNILFEEFLEHVESHFSGSDSELSIEHNFELVSHTVGNF